MLSRAGNDLSNDLFVHISGFDLHDVRYVVDGCCDQKYLGWIFLYVDAYGIYSCSDDCTCSQEKRKLVKIHDIRCGFKRERFESISLRCESVIFHSVSHVSHLFRFRDVT